MLIINKQKLEPGALNDKNDRMHEFAVEYDKGINFLRKVYGKSIRFKRVGFPKKSKGVDSRGNEVSNLQAPTPMLLMPLKAQVNGRTGLELWECALGNPKLLPNGQWEMGNKQSYKITENFTLDLYKDAELAFFIYFKSPFFYNNPEKPNVKSLLVVDDPIAEDKREEERKMQEVKLDSAVYGILQDEEKLRFIAPTYGVQTKDREAVTIRKQLRLAILEGEKRKRRDPMAKGIEEFLFSLKVDDAVRLRNLIGDAILNTGKIKWNPDGRYTVGTRELFRVSESEFKNRFDHLCNHLGHSAGREKLQDLLKDLVDKDYLDRITDEKVFGWLGRLMGLKVEFKKTEEVRQMVYDCFVQITN